MDLMLRKAVLDDCLNIAQLFSMATDGVADYVWSTLQADYPGLSLLEIGAKQFARQTDLSYQNCTAVECDKNLIGMMIAFPMQSSKKEFKDQFEEVKRSEISSGTSNVLTPYYQLKAPGTLRIAGLALSPEFRGQGIGTQLLSLAQHQAQELRFSKLSLLAFEQNTGAVMLYQRNGFKIVNRASVVPHRLIRRTGDVLLMTAPV